MAHSELFLLNHLFASFFLNHHHPNLTIMSEALFTPIKVGSIQLQHRIGKGVIFYSPFFFFLRLTFLGTAMAPLTRFRAHTDHSHSDIAIKYYTQRCVVPGTLIITEATFIHDSASGYPSVPSICTQSQIAAWKKIVDAVHKKDCKIVMQLWALGKFFPAYRFMS